MRWLDSITDSMGMNLSKPRDSEGPGSLASCSPWDPTVGHDLETEQQQQQQYVITYRHKTEQMLIVPVKGYYIII